MSCQRFDYKLQSSSGKPLYLVDFVTQGKNEAHIALSWAQTYTSFYGNSK